jgi:uncharacterized membrane protein YgcG
VVPKPACNSSSAGGNATGHTSNKRTNPEYRKGVSSSNVGTKKRKVMSQKVMQGRVVPSAFPKFCKCDSLLFLPTTFTKHLNSSDFPSLASLFNVHAERDCAVKMSDSHTISISKFLYLLELMNTLYPDSFGCVSTLHATDNAVHATILFKCTDCPSIHHAMLSSHRDANITSILALPRSRRLMPNLSSELLKLSGEEADSNSSCSGGGGGNSSGSGDGSGRSRSSSEEEEDGGEEGVDLLASGFSDEVECMNRCSSESFATIGNKISAGDAASFRKFLDSDADLVMNGQLKLTLTVHEDTKKIVAMDFASTITSVCPVGSGYTCGNSTMQKSRAHFR